jgi:hypothetical protein
VVEFKPAGRINAAHDRISQCGSYGFMLDRTNGMRGPNALMPLSGRTRDLNEPVKATVVAAESTIGTNC